MDRLLAGGSVVIEPCTIQSMWDDFLQSDDFLMAKEHWESEARRCSPPTHHAALPHWQRALTSACVLWHFHEEEKDIIRDDIFMDADEEQLCGHMWSTIVFLMNGLYHMRHGSILPSRHTHTDEQNDPTEFLLHAATDSLALCNDFDSTEMAISGHGSSSALFVFQQILQNYESQLGQVGPILGRYPIHIAAANLSLASPAGHNHNCSFEILEAMLSKCPQHILATKDSTGVYPLHLAAANGCPWQAGLQSLVCAAPELLDDTSLPPAFEFAAAKASLDTLFELIRLAPHTIQRST
jgi:hypothetical protein